MLIFFLRGQHIYSLLLEWIIQSMYGTYGTKGILLLVFWSITLLLWRMWGGPLIASLYFLEGDCSVQLIDVVEGKVIKVFKEDQAVEVIKFNPSNPNLFLSGGSKGSLRLWDIRSGLVTKEFHRSLGTILDIEFSADGRQFISSTDTTRSNISENTIIVWDVLRQVPLSNQVICL